MNIPLMKQAGSECWPGQATQADRRRARVGIVLEDAGIAGTTLERYHFSVSWLIPVLESVDTGLAHLRMDSK